MGLLSWISSVKWFKPLSGGFPPPASLVFLVPAFIVGILFQAHGPVGWVLLGIVVGLLIYVPSIVIDSFRSKRRVRFAPWFARLPFWAKILLAVLTGVAAVVIGIARTHL